jgi:hypothetical protein
MKDSCPFLETRYPMTISEVHRVLTSLAWVRGAECAGYVYFKTWDTSALSQD